MKVSDKVALVASTRDHELLARLANEKSPGVGYAILDRHVCAGDVADALLVAVLERHQTELFTDYALASHRSRTLPVGAALLLAHRDPHLLLDVDAQTVRSASALDDPAWAAPLAWRAGDAQTLIAILDGDTDAPARRLLHELLVGYLLTPTLAGNSTFAAAMLRLADRLDADDEAMMAAARRGDVGPQSELAVLMRSREEAADLRVLAAQNDDVFADHLSALAAGRAVVTAENVVSAGLGPYGGRRGKAPRDGAFAAAIRLWQAGTWCIEQDLARAVIHQSGGPVAVLETDLSIYVATPDALRAYQKGAEKAYTYVHLHLGAATTMHLAPGARIRLPNSLPALKYRRETAPRPDDPDGPALDAIVWDWPFTPAIYGTSTTEAYFAVADGQVALTKIE